MTRIYSFLFCCIVLATTIYGANQENKIEEIGAHLQIVNDIAKFRTQFPDVKLIPLQRSVPESKQTIRYTLGRRISADRIIGQGNNNYGYPTLQDVSLQLRYPQSGGVGNVVTYVEIQVDQSSNTGNAYIASGGIGQRNISIVVEAKRTSFFSYRAAFYGY